MLDIVDIKEYQPSDLGFRQLVLPPGHAEVIEALIKTRKIPSKNSQGPRRETFTADVVKGKGKGLIILLHGAPGVGKTSTAGVYDHALSLPITKLT
jgi:2-phosphoglycerate kinase